MHVIYIFLFTCEATLFLTHVDGSSMMDEAALLEPDLLELPSDDEVKEPSGEHVRISMQWGLATGVCQCIAPYSRHPIVLLNS